MINDYALATKLLELQPQTDQQLRNLWVSAPYPETKALLWEIRRLQNIIVGLHQNAVALTSGQTGAISAFETYARTLMKEPCVQAYMRKIHPTPENDEDTDAWLYGIVAQQRIQATTQYTVPDGDHIAEAYKCADESGRKAKNPTTSA